MTVAGLTILLSSCGAGTDPRVAADVKVPPTGSIPPQPLADEGLPVLNASGYVVTRFRDINPPGDLLAEGDIVAFADAQGGSIAIVLEDLAEVQPDENRGTFRTDNGSSPMHAQAILIESDRKYTITVSDIKDSAGLLHDLAGWIETRGIATVSIELERRGFSALPTEGSISNGYALDYVGSKGSLSLLVYPVSGELDVVATTKSSATSFLSVRNGRRFIEPAQVSGDLPQLRWVDNGYLIQLVGSNSIELANQVANFVGTLADLRALPETGISATPVTETVALGGMRLDRHAGFEGYGSGVCLTNTSGRSSCAEFAAVRSFAQLELDGIFYLVAVVPDGVPTTLYRTEPKLQWSDTAVGGWVYSIAVVEKGTGSVSLFYTTQGVAPAELETVFNFDRD